jgi:hypothetical protein
MLPLPPLLLLVIGLGGAWRHLVVGEGGSLGGAELRSFPPQQALLCRDGRCHQVGGNRLLIGWEITTTEEGF